MIDIEPASPTVLVVDDDTPTRTCLRYFLEDSGYRVFDADGGDTGVAMALSLRPDVVLLDLQMPCRDGLSVLAELRERLPDLPVLVISVNNAVKTAVHAIHVGASDYILKPITDPAILQHAVSRALERQRLLLSERRQRQQLELEVALRTRDLRASEEKYRLIFESLQDVYCEILPDGSISEASPSISAVLGYGRREIIGQPVWNIGLRRGDAIRLFGLLNVQQRVTDYELTLLDRNGQRVFCAITAQLEHSATHQPVKITGMLRDISERKRAEAAIAHQAYHDDLTGLPNRVLLTQRLARAIGRAERGGPLGALLFFDLDHFKTINDSLGHVVGDTLLVQVASRLSGRMRDGDTAARIGGDEFVALLNDLGPDPTAAAATADARAEQLRAALAQKYRADAYDLYVTPSIGIALFPTDARSVDDAMKFADAAMFRAKASGRNSVSRYRPAMQAAAHRRLALEQDLRQAIGSDQLSLDYQPVYDADARLVGAEALLRWQHPRRGPVSPETFIPVAEESGQILPLGNWALAETCRQLAAWRGAGRLIGGLSFACNVSARQVQQDGLVPELRRLLRTHRLDPQSLKLELTERIMLDNLPDALAKLNALRALGVGFAIDDFGTGYSSLAYLRKLPVDTLKIDRGFVADITRDGGGAAIVDTIIAMAQHLGLDVIAEGVESAGELRFLRSRGCQFYQGFYFSEPLPAARFEQLLPTLPRAVADAAG